MKSEKAQKILLRMAAVILIITAVLKFYAIGSSLIGPAHPFWSAPNPIIPLVSERDVLLFASFIEIGVAVYLWWPPAGLAKFAILLWLSGAFFLYHSIIDVVTTGSCYCLGITRGPLVNLQNDLSLLLLAVLFICGICGCANCVLKRHMRNQATKPLFQG
jgi:hypothetical protein